MSGDEWHGSPTGIEGHRKCRKPEKRPCLYDDEQFKFISKKQAYDRNCSMYRDRQQNRDRGKGQFGYGREKLLSDFERNYFYNNSRDFSNENCNYMNKSGKFDLKGNLHFESRERNYNYTEDGSRSEEESSDSGIWSHQSNADETFTYDHGKDYYRGREHTWNPRGRGYRPKKRWHRGHGSGHLEKSILQMSTKEKIHEFGIYLQNGVQKVNAIQTIENGLACSRLGLKSEYHVQVCKTVSGKPNFTGVLRLSGVFMGRSFGTSKKETKHGTYDTALNNLIHKSVDEIFQLEDPGIEAIRDEDVRAKLEKIQETHVHISDADNVQAGNNNTQMINIPPSQEKQQISVYQSGCGGKQKVTVNINMDEEMTSSDSETGSDFALKIRVGKKDGKKVRYSMNLEKTALKALTTKEGHQSIIEPIETVLAAKTVSITEGSVIIRLRPKNKDSISKLKEAIENKKLHIILAKMIELDKFKLACSGCEVILTITACILMEDFDGKNKSLVQHGNILIRFRQQLQDSDSRLKTAVQNGDLQRILFRFAKLEQVQSALGGSDLVLNVTASLPRAKKCLSISQIHSCKDQDLGEVPENEDIPPNTSSERLLGLRRMSCRLTDTVCQNQSKPVWQSLNLKCKETQPNTQLSTYKSSLKFNPFDDQDKSVGSSQAHEVLWSDGSKQPAKDEETLTQTDETIVDKWLESIETGVHPPMEVPSDHEAVKQDSQHLVPEEILRMDERSIKLYKEALQCGKEKVYNTRVMIVGQYGVGKVTLAKRLFGKAVNLSNECIMEGRGVNCYNVSLDNEEWNVHAQESEKHDTLQILVMLLSDRNQKLVVSSMQEVQSNPILKRETIPESGDKVPVDGNDIENENKLISFNQYHCQKLKTNFAWPPTSYLVKVNQAYRAEHKEPDASDIVMSGGEGNTSRLKKDHMVELMQLVNKSTHILHGSKEKTAAVSVVDFAGQFLIYSTHQSFLTKRAIYLMVVDLSRPICGLVEEDECFFDSEGTKVCKDHVSDLVKVWLNSTHSCSPATESSTPPVILVGTHSDKISHTSRQADTAKYFEQVRLCLQKGPPRYHLTDEDFVIDNTHCDSRLKDLRRKIVDLASKQSYWGEEVPVRWICLEEALMKLKALGLKIVPLSIVEEINQSGSVQIETKDELDLFLRFQHDIGTILYFSTEGLREKIVLDPQWLTDALKSLNTAKRSILANQPSIIDKWFEFSKNGKLTQELIDAIWTEEKHREFYENKEHILYMLEKLNIVTRPRCYNKEGKIMVEEYFLAPCMLHQKTPTDIISMESNVKKESSSVLCFSFVGKFLPSSVFHRLIAACLAHWPIAKSKSENQIFCDCCVFDLDLSHKLAIYFKEYVIFSRVTNTGIADKTQSSNLCIKVRDFITWNLSRIIKNVGQGMCFELFLQCSQSTGADVDSLIPVSLLRQNAEISCRPHNNSHVIVSHELLKFWFEEKNYEHEQQSVIERRQSFGEDKNDNRYYDVDLILTQEQVNFSRLCNALTTVCSEAMRHVLVKNVSSPHENIYQAIQANKTILTDRRLVSPGQWQNALLNKYQCQVVFPDPHGQVTGTVDQFDISLLYIMIRNVSSVVAPATGWGNLPADKPRDVTLGASMERIHLLRDKISGYSINGKVCQKEFEEYWSMIGDILHDIENIIGDRDYQTALDRCKSELITAHEAHEQRRKFQN